MIGHIALERFMIKMKIYYVKTIAKVLESGLFSLTRKLTILILPALLLSVILLFASVMHGMGSGVLIDNFIKHYQPIFPITIAPMHTLYAIV